MRKILTLVFSLMIVATIAYSSNVQACGMDGYCPMMTLKNSKELGLSQDQESKISAIRDQMKSEMQELKKKYSDQVKNTLTAKQRKKYDGLKSDGMMMDGHHGKMMMKDGKQGDTCPMMK